MKYCPLFFLLAYLSIFPSHAGISSDLTGFFNSLGSSVNTTAAGAYHDQAAGYYTGGGLFSRNSVREVQVGTVQMPGFRAGCGGIDIFMGGLSFIKSEELIRALRAVGASAASYAFMLALQTVSPQIYNIVNELNALAQKINNMNINSCEMAETAVGGLWPKSDAASRHICHNLGTKEGYFTDWVAAKHSCGSGGDRATVLSKAQRDPLYKDMLAGDFNLAWMALNKNSFLSSDRELAELFMSLSGTIISIKNNDRGEVRVLPSLADRDSLINALMNGGRARIYRCDEAGAKGCLNPALAEMELKEGEGFQRKVRALLVTLVDKIYEDTALSEAEQGFLSSTKLPIYKILNVSTAYRRGQAPLDVHEYADLIAIDILYKYISETLDLIHESTNQLKAAQVDESHIRRFEEGLHQVRERIVARRSVAFQHMQEVLGLVQKTQLIEKQLHAGLGAMSTPIERD